MSPLLIKISKDLKLVCCPRALAPTLVTSPWSLARPRACASYPSCVAVYSRDARSRRVLCRWTLSSIRYAVDNDGSRRV